MKKLMIILLWALHLTSIGAIEVDFAIDKIIIEYAKSSVRVNIDTKKLTETELNLFLQLAKIRYNEYLATKDNGIVEDGPFVTRTEAFIHIEIKKEKVVFPFYELYGDSKLLLVPRNKNDKLFTSLDKLIASLVNANRP
jgi:hypothetical protein